MLYMSRCQSGRTYSTITKSLSSGYTLLFRRNSSYLCSIITKSSQSLSKMGVHLAGISQAKEKLRRTISPKKGSMSRMNDVPKGHFAVYVGDAYRRFVIPIAYLNHPLFQELLHWAEEEFGYSHPTGGLTIPCSEDYFITITSSMSSSL